MPKIDASRESCLCDFTFDFYWQHMGTRLDPDQTVSGVSFRQLVEALRQGKVVRIKGDVGSRLGSSLGVDLIRLGGKGGPLETTGKIIVDGNVGHRMGMSMLRGAIYVSGEVEPPLGNVVETESDLSGYRKFISLTEALERSFPVQEPNHLYEDGLAICDGILRDTLGARNPSDRIIRLRGDAGMSTGILMRSGLIRVLGDADRNTGVLLQGGKIVIKGSTGDFTGAEMHGGEIFIAKDAGSFACAKMKGGAIYAREGKPVSPAQARMLNSSEQASVARVLGLSPLYAMMYRKLSL
ncbi:Molybdenum-containing formylmethanofuran dehydrogenase 1 subunit C [uncultured archaeon]|nr:Molybdenum-containing formylmethanofuran dehydrogenase 1 subunit C [uncultured archaeon]